MTIDINNIPPASTQVTDVGSHRGGSPAQTEKAPDKPNTPAQSSTDQVSLTPAAQQLRQLEAQIADQPVVNSQKVAAVKEALANGSFEIDPNRIAGKMMSLERALGDMA